MNDDRADNVSAATSDGETRGIVAYEESLLADPINPDASEPPLVSLSEGDTFQLVPDEKLEVGTSEPEVARQPSPPKVNVDEPTPVPERPSDLPTIEPNAAARLPAEVRAPMRKLPAIDLDTPQSKQPAPTLIDLEDEFFPEQSESPSKLPVPPEPAPPDESDNELELDTEPKSEPKSQPQSKAAAPDAVQKLASTGSDSAIKTLAPKPRQVPVRMKEVAPTVDNEVLSLDSPCDGLVFDSQGFGYVSHRDRIVRFSPTGESSVWTKLSSPKGHRIEPEGTHLVCDTERRAVLRLSFDGKVIGTAAKECDGTALRAPYDIAVDPNGGFYFTDPGYVQVKNPIGKLHYVARDGQVSVVVAKIGYPTGITFDPAQQRLFVAESMFNRILEFRLSEAGTIESHAVFAQLPKSPDSEYHLANLCLDAAGNLYVTQPAKKAVHVFDPQGRPIGDFSTGAVAPSSVALRVADAPKLFFTGELENRIRNGKVLRLDLGK